VIDRQGKHHIVSGAGKKATSKRGVQSIKAQIEENYLGLTT